jgi:large subunit ribosomal protein L21
MSKKAVVKVLGHQYIAAEGDVITVDLLPEDTKKLDLEALLVIDDDKTTVGTPVAAKVTAEVVESKVAGEKIRVIRYKSKKRVHKEMGHRQKYSTIKILKIA